MSKLKPWLLLVLVFFAGVVCGVVGLRVIVHHIMVGAAQHQEQVWQRLEKRLGSDLALTPEQRTQAHGILMGAHQQIQDLRTELQSRYLGIVDKAQADISASLTPEQRAKFEKLIKQEEFLWRPAPGAPKK